MSLNTADWSEIRQLRDYLLQLLLFLFVGIALGSIIVICVGYNPLRVYTLLIREGFLTPRGWMIAIQRGTPLILTAAAATLAFQAGAINMGIAGQFVVGSAFAAMAQVNSYPFGTIGLWRGWCSSRLYPSLLQTYIRRE